MPQRMMAIFRGADLVGVAEAAEHQPVGRHEHETGEREREHRARERHPGDQREPRRQEQRREQRQRHQERTEGDWPSGNGTTKRSARRAKSSTASTPSLTRQIRRRAIGCASSSAIVPWLYSWPKAQRAERRAREDVDGRAGAADRERQAHRRGQQPGGADRPHRQQRAELLLDHAPARPGLQRGDEDLFQRQRFGRQRLGRARPQPVDHVGGVAVDHHLDSRPRRRSTRAPAEIDRRGSVAKRA